jgi:hypothetical protein
MFISQFDSYHNKRLIAQVSGKVVIKEESMMFHFFSVVLLFLIQNLIDGTSTFSCGKETKFSKDVWNVNFSFIADGILSD